MKISVIMQVYLGEYPGSRSNPIDKFHRAVKSFLDQTYLEKELVIVSDGCNITHTLYNDFYKDTQEIKYAFIDKPSFKMYDVIENNKKYYRGLPRQVGIEISSGDIICYFDSDDYLLKNHLSNINEMWKLTDCDVDWLSNTSWYDNQHRIYNPIGGDLSSKTFKIPDPSALIEIDNLPDLWYPTSLIDGKISLETATVSHKRNCKTKWKDSIENYEDAVFFDNLKRDHHKGMKYENPTYVRCHWINRWDF
jgi:glycosyltransferase involved in cell wall biosynthesis